jgi:hypothetical protein
MKPKYAATLPDGREVTRQTQRTYTNIVAVRRDDGQGWGVWSWAGRFDLAFKASNQARKFYDEVEILDVRDA